MNVDELAAKYGLTNEWIEESAAAYERGDYPHEDGQVYSGSHLDAVGKKRVTVVYPCEKVQRANRIAKSSDDESRTFLASRRITRSASLK